MAIGYLVDLVLDRLVDLLMAVSQAGDGSATCGVEELGPVFQEDVATFAANGLFGHKSCIPMEDGAGWSF